VRSARRRAQDSADTTDVVGYTREGIAKSIAEDLQQGWVVNLGAGMPVLVARFIPPGRGITLHMENGILGCGPPPPDEGRDQDLSNAGGEYATLEPGAAIFDSAMSFSIVRGGYLDVTVLGGLEVAANGDLANWYLPGSSTGVGGAMDLVQGAKAVWIAMEHTTRNGAPKILNECSYILTGPNVVKRIYTNLGSFSLEGSGLELIGLAPGITVDYVRERTEPSFTVKHGVG
jgi:3-oxoacid CoA-transferase subunit B